jgi:hypothetical protein
MAKTWVLDTETKGTGANVVPLERVLRGPAPNTEAPAETPVPTRPPPAAADGVPPRREPPTFKVVDVMTLAVLAEGASARATVDVLERVGSVVDVRVYVWHPERERWRLLSLGEQKALWSYRAR